MRILILNWRDIKNPAGGGAEILTHEMAKRWVKAGHNVTQFSSSFPNAKPKEVIDGVTFLRKGTWWTVHVMAFFYYLKHRNESDVIMDEVHWFPFFAAVYAPKKTVALTCEVATQLLFRILPFPIALVFATIEKLYLILYRKVPTMVISESTKQDLLATGHIKQNIQVIPMGLTLPKKIVISPKEKKLTMICVGRLNVQKGTLNVIHAFAQVKKSFPESVLWLVGSGDEQFKEKINALTKELNITDSVTFYGFVSEEKKFNLLSRAHVLMSASSQEGWGLTIPEAGYVHTPSVVYNIQGFRDIIDQNKNGILVDTNVESLGREVVNALNDKKSYKKLQNGAYKKAHQYTWDKTAESGISFIKKHIT